MAKRPGTDDGMLTSPTILRNFAADLNAGDVSMDCGDGAADVSLEEILKLYGQPINEEQAWAVCYQCCSALRVPRPTAWSVCLVKDPSSILLHRDGTVSLRPGPLCNGRITVR